MSINLNLKQWQTWVCYTANYMAMYLLLLIRLISLWFVQLDFSKHQVQQPEKFLSGIRNENYFGNILFFIRHVIPAISNNVPHYKFFYVFPPSSIFGKLSTCILIVVLKIIHAGAITINNKSETNKRENNTEKKKNPMSSNITLNGR